MKKFFITALATLAIAACTATSFRTASTSQNKVVASAGDTAEGVIIANGGDHNDDAGGTISSGGANDGAAAEINQIGFLPLVPLCGCQIEAHPASSSIDLSSLIGNGIGNIGTNNGANNTGNGNGNYNIGDNNGNNNTGNGNGNYNCGSNNGNNNGGNNNGNYNVTDDNGNGFSTDGNGNGPATSGPAAACCRCVQNDGSTLFTTANNCTAPAPSSEDCAAQ